MSLSLVDRLRAALDRTEEIARAAIRRSGTADWAANPYGNVHPADPGGNDWLVVAPYAGDLGEVGVHIAAQDPRAVLRSVAAHRKILDAYEASRTPSSDSASDRAEAMGVFAGLTIAVRALASIYFPEETTDG